MPTPQGCSSCTRRALCPSCFFRRKRYGLLLQHVAEHAELDVQVEFVLLFSGDPQGPIFTTRVNVFVANALLPMVSWDALNLQAWSRPCEWE